MNNNNTSSFVNNEGIIPTKDYQQWLKTLKVRYRSTQIKASVRVNGEMLRLYWSLGRDIVAMKVEEQWGKGIIDKLSLDMKAEFDNQQGFPVSNIRLMKRWYSFYIKDLENRYQPGTELEMPDKFAIVTWRHHVEIIRKCKTVKEASFYIDKTIEGGWSRSNVYNMRRLYLVFPKIQTVSGKSDSSQLSLSLNLSWSHYLELLSLNDPLEISFYMHEAENDRWSVRELKRQMSSILFHRLAPREMWNIRTLDRNIDSQYYYHLFIQLDVIFNYELEQHILSFGDYVEVVQPQTLCEKVCQHSSSSRITNSCC